MYKLWIVIIVLALIIVYMIIFISVNDVIQLKDDISVREARILYMEQKLLDKDFAYTACKVEIDRLDSLILGAEMYEIVKDTLMSAILHIGTLQSTMDRAGIVYLKWIIDSILSEGYFEDIEEQVEYFEGLGE